MKLVYTHTHTLEMNQLPVYTNAYFSALDASCARLLVCGFLCTNILSAFSYVSSAFPFMTLSVDRPFLVCFLLVVTFLGATGKAKIKSRTRGKEKILSFN